MFTLTIIKPDGIRRNLQGVLLDLFMKNKFKIVEQKLTKFSLEDAQEFYKIHSSRPFYNDLCKFMSSGPISIQVLEKENAVEDFRALIGATNPSQAQLGTLRYMFGVSIDENTLHGSDSQENAIIERNFCFK